MQYHLLRTDGVWQFRKAGSPEALFDAETKVEAMDKMQDYMESREGDVVIHKTDGEIQQHRTYPARSESGSNGLSATAWSIIGVVAVAAVTAASVVYYYRDAIPTSRLRLPR
jgi:hypothetical protein